MLNFPSSVPMLRGKQEVLDVQDLSGLLKLRLQIGDLTLLNTIYTRVDQVFVIWGVSIALMFGVAQFYPVNWTAQAIAWSVLTCIVTGIMALLIWFWVTVERLRWLLYGWIALMLLGTLVTDYGIFLGHGPILMHLCPIWLGISALGYVATGFGIGSRTFVLLGLIHGLTIALLAWVPSWQFLVTGFVMSVSLFFLAEIQWDMRPPILSPQLTAAQQAFNREQNRLRQLS